MAFWFFLSKSSFFKFSSYCCYYLINFDFDFLYLGSRKPIISSWCCYLRKTEFEKFYIVAAFQPVRLGTGIFSSWRPLFCNFVSWSILSWDWVYISKFMSKYRETLFLIFSSFTKNVSYSYLILLFRNDTFWKSGISGTVN